MKSRSLSTYRKFVCLSQPLTILHEVLYLHNRGGEQPYLSSLNICKPCTWTKDWGPNKLQVTTFPSLSSYFSADSWMFKGLMKTQVYVGLGTEFRSEKIPRNRLGTVSVIPRKKVPIPRHSEFRGRANSEARNGTKRNGIPRKNEVLRNLHGLYDHFDNLDSDLLLSETFCGNFTGLRFIPVC